MAAKQGETLEGEEECTAFPPCGVDINCDDSSSNISESPIKRRPVAKTGSWRFQSKSSGSQLGKDRRSPWAASRKKHSVLVR